MAFHAPVLLIVHKECSQHFAARHDAKKFGMVREFFLVIGRWCRRAAQPIRDTCPVCYEFVARLSSDRFKDAGFVQSYSMQVLRVEAMKFFVVGYKDAALADFIIRGNLANLRVELTCSERYSLRIHAKRRNDETAAVLGDLPAPFNLHAGFPEPGVGEDGATTAAHTPSNDGGVERSQRWMNLAGFDAALRRTRRFRC